MPAHASGGRGGSDRDPDVRYRFWGSLTEALRTGEPQNEAKTDGGDFFGVLYADEARLEQFLAAMQGIQAGNFHALLDTIDLSSVTTLCDVGGANGTFCALAAQRHPHLRAVTFDLAPVRPIAERTLAAMGVADRVTVVAGDFFVDALPSADVIVMGNVLHNWNDHEKQLLMAKAYAALRPGGRLVAIENVIDDARRANTFGLLTSLNMLIETAGGSDYTAAQFDEWSYRASSRTRRSSPSPARPARPLPTKRDAPSACHARTSWKPAAVKSSS